MTDQEDPSKTIVDRIFTLIEGEAGVLVRDFNADCTLVEQATKTDCFYRF